MWPWQYYILVGSSSLEPREKGKICTRWGLRPPSPTHHCSFGKVRCAYYCTWMI